MKKCLLIVASLLALMVGGACATEETSQEREAAGVVDSADGETTTSGLLPCEPGGSGKCSPGLDCHCGDRCRLPNTICP